LSTFNGLKNVKNILIKMETDEITQIKIGTLQVGIIGLKEVMTKLATSMADAPDWKLERVLIQEISRKNYIPEKAKAEYGQSLLKVFKKQIGRAVAEPQEEGLTIRVLGQGCPNCRGLTQRIMEVLSELNLAADFEHVTDIKEIARYKVMQSPALLINGQIVAVGQVPNKAQLIEWFKKRE
jgi:small redox-active disulfide protein 2